MAISEETVEHITPSRAELQPFHKIYCKEAKCSATFTNAGNYHLHLMRHHKIMPENKKVLQTRRLYYCPVTECVYNSNSKISSRHFKHMKNLRQHFQKIHFKSFICERCGRAFPTEGQFQTHAETICGRRYNCLACRWDFETKEALELHGKRKKHLTQNESATPRKKSLAVKREKSGLEALNSITVKVLANQHKDTQTKIHYHDSETQTEQLITVDLVPSASLMDAICHDSETQTETQIKASSNDINDFHDIETQTDPTLQQYQYQRHTSPMSNSNLGGGFLDQMLAQAPLAHMHTQTCNDYLLSELGLADIQTQTNWTSFTDGAGALEHSKHMNTTTSTSKTGFAHDELLVSTETQTSFTQCLLESTAESGPVTTDNASTCTTGEENHAIHYAHLYNTQCTQTCDLLLEGLFGGQENDLITGFQSTYTQT